MWYDSRNKSNDLKSLNLLEFNVILEVFLLNNLHSPDYSCHRLAYLFAAIILSKFSGINLPVGWILHRILSDQTFYDCGGGVDDRLSETLSPSSEIVRFRVHPVPLGKYFDIRSDDDLIWLPAFNFEWHPNAFKFSRVSLQ